MEKEEELNSSKIMESTLYVSTMSNQLNLFKSRKLTEKNSFTKTLSNNHGFKTVSNTGNNFKISNKSKTSISPSKRSITSLSNNSNSP